MNQSRRNMYVHPSTTHTTTSILGLVMSVILSSRSFHDSFCVYIEVSPCLSSCLTSGVYLLATFFGTCINILLHVYILKQP
jgi:hypothetical protein